MVGFKPKREEGGGNKNDKKEKQRHIGYCFGLGEGRGFESVRALDWLEVKQEEGKLVFSSSKNTVLCDRGMVP